MSTPNRETETLKHLVDSLNRDLNYILSAAQNIFTPEALPEIIDNIISNYLDQMRGEKNKELQLFTNGYFAIMYVISDTKFTDNGAVSYNPNETVIPEKSEAVIPFLTELILKNPDSFEFMLTEKGVRV